MINLKPYVKSYTYNNHKNTEYLFQVLGPKIRKKKFMTRDEFIDITTWKSPRPRKYLMKKENSNELIMNVSKKAFRITNEEGKINLLDSFSGVGIPMVSAILSIIFPDEYGIVDKRTWDVLWDWRMVSHPHKTLSSQDYLEYLQVIRNIGREQNLTPRQVDMGLFSFSKKNQGNENLYKQ